MAWPNIYGIDGRQLSATSPPTSERPTLILVHDAFLTATHMAPLHNGLASLGYRVNSPQLPSTGTSFVADALEEDVEAICTVTRPELRAGRNVVMIVSGYGAVPSTLAAEQLNHWSLETPRAGRVTRFVYIGGMLLNEGERVGSVLTLPPGSLEIDRMIRLKTAAARSVFQPCSSSVLTPAVAAMQYLSSNILTAPNASEAWADIPAIYIVCEQDQYLTSRAQENFASRLEDSNAQARVVRMQVGHAPFFTHATQIATIVDRLTQKLT